MDQLARPSCYNIFLVLLCVMQVAAAVGVYYFAVKLAMQLTIPMANTFPQ